MVTYMFMFHLFGALWMYHFVAAVGVTSASAAFSYWYFNSRKKSKHDQYNFIFLSALGRVVRHHLGSLALGSFLISIIEYIRLILEYVDRQINDLQDANKCLKYGFKVCRGVLWCFEKFLKFFTQSAYIMIAIKGYGFCRASVESFKHTNNVLRLLTSAVGTVVTLMGKLVICLASVWFLVIMLHNRSNISFDANNVGPGQVYLKSSFLPAICTGMLAYTVASMMFYTYGVGVDTLVMCFSKDFKAVNRTSPASLSPNSDDRMCCTTTCYKYIQCDAKSAAPDEVQTEFMGPERVVEFLQTLENLVELKEANARNILKKENDIERTTSAKP